MRYTHMSNGNINITRLKGNLGKNPESCQNESGKPCAKASLFYHPFPLQGNKVNVAPVIFHLRFYNEVAHRALSDLHQGDFLEITAAQLRIARDEKTAEPVFFVTVWDYTLTAAKADSQSQPQEQSKKPEKEEPSKNHQWKKGSSIK